MSSSPGRCDRLQLVDGLGAGLVGERRIGFAMALGQIDQVRVDFVLQQRGTGGGAAPADVPLLQHRHVEAMAGQFIGDQRAGDTAAEHGDVAAMVGFQARKRLHQPVADRPEGVTAFEVHAHPVPSRGDHARRPPAIEG